ncbi:hypothetical protein D3C84_567760 [compost metagenome]
MSGQCGQRRRLRQVGDPAVAHRAVATALGRLAVAEVGGQALTQAVLGGEQLEHGVDAGDFAAFLLLEVTVQLGAQ